MESGSDGNIAGIKQELRRSARQKRSQLDESLRREYSRRICRHLSKSTLFLSAARIHCYRSFGAEVETEELFAAAYAGSKQVVVPVTDPNNPGEMRHLCVPRDQVYAPGRFNVPEPVFAPGALPVEVRAEEFKPEDLVILPLLAFDRTGVRLGYGGGYYDRFLAACGATRVGLAFGLQESEKLPVEAHDVRLEVVVTEAGVRRLPGSFA